VQSIERASVFVFPDDRMIAAQAAKMGKPLAEIATGKMAAPFTQLSNMVLSHASEEGASGDNKSAGGKSLVDNLKSMLSKPKDKAA
jgi:pilus assembly protein CpaE